MPSVTIDAGVLAAPLEHGTAEDAHRYVETLLDWSRLLDKPWIAIYMSERTSEVLFDDGLFPFREQLGRLFTANGIVEYDVNTIAQHLDRLLQRTPSFETYFSIQDVLTDELSTEPDISQFCSGTRLQSELARCIVLLAILRKHCRELTRDHSLILRQAPGKIIRVRALITLLEHQRTDLDAIPVSPQYFDGDVMVCDDFRSLMECLDESEILLKATDEVGIKTAIRIAVYKARLARGTSPDWDAVPRLRIGREFRSTLEGIHPTHQLAAKLLRAIVETLEQGNMSATHHLRTGGGGEDPQRVREIDQANAWRRDIDREHHLHYWNCQDNTVEIASVSFPHDNLTIPE